MSETILMGAFYKNGDKLIPLPPYNNYSDDWTLAFKTIADYLLDEHTGDTFTQREFKEWARRA